MEAAQIDAGRTALRRANGAAGVIAQVIQNPYKVGGLNAAGYYEMVWNERVNGRTKQKHKSTGCRDRAEAQRFVDDWFVTEAMLPPELGAAESVPRTIGEVLDFWLENHIGRKDMERYRDTAGKLDRVKMLVGGIDARLCNDDLAKRYGQLRAATPLRAKRTAPVKQSTISSELMLVQAAMNYAKLKSFADLKSDHADGIIRLSFPKRFAPREFALSYEREAEFHAHAMGLSLSFWDERGHLRESRDIRPLTLFVGIGLDTGARAEAICDLTWRRINKGDEPVDWCWIDFRLPGEEETNKRRAKVRCPERLTPLLVKARQEAVARVEAWNATRPAGTPARSVLDERVIGKTPGAIGRSFDRLRDRLVKADPYWTQMTPHVMRHTWATLADEAGLSVGAIAAQLADNPNTVARIYMKKKLGTIEALRGMRRL